METKEKQKNIPKLRFAGFCGGWNKRKLGEMLDLITKGITPKDKLVKYATLFHQKIEAYFKKTNNVMLGNNIDTKVIRMTVGNLNQREQIVLNRSALMSCELDDLFK